MLRGNVVHIAVVLCAVSVALGCASPRKVPQAALEVQEKTAGVGAIHDPGTSVSSGSSEAEGSALEEEAQVVLEGPAVPLTSQEEQVLAAPTKLFGAEAGIDEHVKRYFSLFAEKNRRTMTVWLQRAQLYLPYIQERLRVAGLPEELAYVPLIESGFDPKATSPAGAAGIWQFMPETARALGLRVDWWVDERRDMVRSTDAAIAYFRKLHEQFGDWKLVLAAYNAGEGCVDRAMKGSGEERFEALAQGQHLASETREYVPKFIAMVKIVSHLGELGFPSLHLASGVRPVPIEVRGATDLRELAQASGMAWAEFERFNAHFRRQVTPPLGRSTVFVPPRAAAAARQYLDSRPSQGAVAAIVPVPVRRGDTWASLARRLGMAVEDLKAMNAGVRLVAGATLYVPRKAAGGKVGAQPALGAGYVVQSGDTVWSIARKFDVAPDAVLRANGWDGVPTLHPGQRIAVPSPQTPKVQIRAAGLKQPGAPAPQKPEAKKAASSGKKPTSQRYAVQPGDTLWSIARRFGISPKELLRHNGLPETAVLRPGDQLVVQVP